MSRLKSAPMPCHECGSSDAVKLNEEGGGYCFSCKRHYKPGEYDMIVVPKPKVGLKKPIFRETIKAFRGISPETYKFYGVETEYIIDREAKHKYPYGDSAKIRIIAEKEFYWEGKYDHGILFGQDKFSTGGKRVVIVEGEVDALSVAEAAFQQYKKYYPVVAVPSATEKRGLINAREWLRSFEDIVLCFDQDEAGRAATQEAIKILGVDRVRIAKLDHKDPNEVLTKQGPHVLIKNIWDAGKYIPKGILNGERLWEAIVEYNSTESIPYPPCVGGLNDKLKGMRFGEISLFVSGTSSGKSTLMREIMLHVLETTEYKIGIASLEETPAETARKLIGMKIRKNPAHKELEEHELKQGFDALFASERILLLDHQGNITDGSIIDKIEYMALNDCKFIFIDHITILTSELSDGYASENSLQDKTMNELARLTKRYPIWIGLVSHLRKRQAGTKAFEEGNLPSIDDIKGSGSIKQVSFDVVAFARNLVAEDEEERNLMKVTVLKCRYTGLTGPCKGAFYHYETGRLVSSTYEEAE
jgi:twinkle protein